jgi:hypothetical protein
MARTIETIIRDYIGDQVMTLAKLTADLDAARDEIATLKLAAAPAAAIPLKKANGAPPPEDPVRARTS